MKAIISIVALDMAFVCISAHVLRGGPNLLPGVAMSDVGIKVDSESPEQSPKTKSYIDIPNEEGRTDPWKHKTGIANIIKNNKKTKLIDKVGNKYHKTLKIEGNPNPLPHPFGEEPPFDPNPNEAYLSEKPCYNKKTKFEDCLLSEGMDRNEVLACSECIDGFLATVVHTSTGCNFYCPDFQTCKDTKCTKEFTTSCWDDAKNMVSCILEYDGCNESEYESECFSPIPTGKNPTGNNPVPSPAPSSTDTDPFNPDDDGGPCAAYNQAHADCLLSYGVSSDDALSCSSCVWNAWKDVGSILCYGLKEEGFCNEVLTCWDTYCNNVCYDEAIDMAGCMLHYEGCTNNEFKNECVPGM